MLSLTSHLTNNHKTPFWCVPTFFLLLSLSFSFVRFSFCVFAFFSYIDPCTHIAHRWMVISVLLPYNECNFSSFHYRIQLMSNARIINLLVLCHLETESHQVLMVTPEGNTALPFFFSQLRSIKARVVQWWAPIHTAANLQDSKACVQSSPLSFLVCEILSAFTWQKERKVIFLP